MLRFVALKQLQYHQQRLKGRGKVGTDDILRWTPTPKPLSSVPSSRLQRVPSVKHEVVRSNDTKTLHLRKQTFNASSSAYSRYLYAKPLPIPRLGSLKRDKHSIRKRLASANRNKPLPPIPFPFLALEKTEVGASSSSLVSSMFKEELKDQENVFYDDLPFLHGKECLARSDQKQELSPSDDENKAQYTAQGQVEAIANSTIDNTISKLLDPSSGVEETTCSSFPSAKAPSPHHPNNHPTNNIATRNQKKNNQDEPLFSNSKVLVRPPSLKVSTNLNTFRFPPGKSPIEKRPYRSRIHHQHHQSLPPIVFKLPSPLLARAFNFQALSASDHVASSLPAILKEINDPLRDDTPSTSHSRKDNLHALVGNSYRKLRRSESCSNISHRPSLSFASSKNALLGLQDRRVNKPDAKVARLPDIQTTTAWSSPQGVITDMDTQSPGEHILQGDVAFKPHDDDYQLQVSDKDRTETDALLVEVTTVDAFKEVHDVDKMLEMGPGVARVKEPLSLAPSLRLDLSGEVLNASDIKRSTRRSHALHELETTEATYVYDLETLIKVHLRVLEMKHWFPQPLHGRLVRCTDGLLQGQKTFQSRLAMVQLAETDRERAPLAVYRNLAEAFDDLQQAIPLYSEFCELRARTLVCVDKHAPGGSTLHLLQKEGKDLLAQLGRRNSRADLKDYLIKPIQRICRYPLLLREILRLTSTNDAEYQLVLQAHDLMKEMAHALDEAQRAVERRMMTELFLKKISETTYPRKANNFGQQQLGGSPRFNSFSHFLESNPHPFEGRTVLDQDLASEPTNSPWPSDPNVNLSEGLSPSALTKTILSEAGSIVLAGALEYVLLSNMPIRLKYYGCFLFETMLVVVKPKKANQYEIRQWLPLRLCELQETTRLDGYTRFGWRILFDHYRIDLGAISATEQNVWVTTLQTRIRAAKDAYEKATREGTKLPAVASSLPWAPTYFTTNLPSSIHVSQPSPTPSPSPWSACSSAIPSPLMPPPPVGQTNTTLVMAPPVGENNWEILGPGSALANYANGNLEQRLHPLASSGSTGAMSGRSEHVVIGGMAGNPGAHHHQQQKQRARSPSCHSHDDHPHHHLMHPHPHTDYSYPSHQQMLHPSNSMTATTPSSWLSDHRTRSNSFDVSRVFTSANNVIKPTQRTLVQNMFKDVSSENVWTTTATTGASMGTGGGSGGVSHQRGSSMASSSTSPMATRSASISKHPFSYFMASSSPSAGPPSPWSSGSLGVSGMATSMTVASTNIADENEGVKGMTSSSSTTSLSKMMRRNNSGSHHYRQRQERSSSPSASGGSQEKSDWDRRRNSATAAIAATLTLNFRYSHKHHHTIHAPSSSSSSSSSHFARSLSVHQQSSDDTFAVPTADETNNVLHNSPSQQQPHRLSVKSRAQFFEKRASLPSFSSLSPSHAPPSSSPSFKAIKRIGPSPKFVTKPNNTPDQEPLHALFQGGEVAPMTEHAPTLDMLGSLQSAGEAARSRRSTRGGSRGGSPTIAHDSNPEITMDPTDFLPIHAPLVQAQTHVEIPKEVEKWAAMGRAKPQKLGFIVESFSSRKSRSNSNSSTTSLRSVAPGNGEQQQQSGEDIFLDNDGSQHCLLRRSSRDSDATTRSYSSGSSSLFRMTSIASSSTTTCSPSLPSMPLDQSDTPDLLDAPRDSTRSRTASSSTDSSFNGNASVHGSLALTPSASVTSCCSLTSCSGSTQDLGFNQAYKEAPLTTSHSLDHIHYCPNDSSNKATPTAHHRRKSLSILQHLTHSASQKFRTLMRTPSGLRRTVISHSMEGREQDKLVGGGHREEAVMEGDGEEEEKEEETRFEH